MALRLEELTAEVVADHLLVHYGVRADEPLLLHALVRDTPGWSGDHRLTTQPTPEVAPCSWFGSATVLIHPGRWPNRQPRHPWFSVLLDAADAFAATLRLPLPLYEWHRELAPSSHGAEKRAIRTARLQLAWTLVADAGPVQPLSSLAEGFRVEAPDTQLLEHEVSLPSRVELWVRRESLPRLPGASS